MNRLAVVSFRTLKGMKRVQVQNTVSASENPRQHRIVFVNWFKDK